MRIADCAHAICRSRWRVPPAPVVPPHLGSNQGRLHHYYAQPRKRHGGLLQNRLGAHRWPIDGPYDPASVVPQARWRGYSPPCCVHFPIRHRLQASPQVQRGRHRHCDDMVVTTPAHSTCPVSWAEILSCHGPRVLFLAREGWRSACRCGFIRALVA